MEKSESHIEKVQLRAFRFLTEGELTSAKALAIFKKEDPEKVRITKDIEVWVRVTRLANDHRVLEFTASESQFVLHSKDLAVILQTQEFDVLDLKARKI